MVQVQVHVHDDGIGGRDMEKALHHETADEDILAGVNDR